MLIKLILDETYLGQSNVLRIVRFNQEEPRISEELVDYYYHYHYPLT